MKEREGDLIALGEAGEFDVIVHGCNCFCTMGAGIAKAIRARFPAAYEADLATEKGSAAKLGTFTYAEVSCGAHRLVVANAYTQHHWRGRGVLLEYEALGRAFRAIAEAFPRARVGYPLIGAGLAGGDWTRIAQIIDAELEGRDHTLVRLPR